MAPAAAIALGPGLIGTFMNVMLYGTMGLQCCRYFNTYENDGRGIKVLVAVLLFADTVNTAFDMVWIYDVLINHFTDVSALARANWVFATDPALVGIIATICQLFFAWRVKTLTGNMYVVNFIRIMSVGSTCGGVGTAIAIHFVPEYVQFQKFRPILIIWLISALICDTTITIALTAHLLRSRTGFPSTDKTIHKIIRLTVQNGLIVTVAATADLVTYLATPTGVHLVFNLPLAKLYTNSLMSTLNTRDLRFNHISLPNVKANTSTVENSTTSSTKVAARRLSRPLAFAPLSVEDVNDAKTDADWSSRGAALQERSDVAIIV